MSDAGIFHGKCRLDISQFEIKSPKIPPAFDGFRILLLTDLHSKQLGKDNGALLSAIDSQTPDIIVATGDMINSRDDDGHVFLSLAHRLTAGYPVYSVFGNHEAHVKKRDRCHSSDIFRRYRSALKTEGVDLLDGTHRIFEQDGERIAFYGLDIPLDYYDSRAQRRHKGIGELQAADIKRQLGIPGNGVFTVLLVHTPFYLESYARWGADLVFAGHVHGGAVRIPFLGGLLSPDRTFFPKYDAGLYKYGGTQMILGRGLGYSTLPLRINNPPEIAVATLRRDIR